MGVVSRLRTTFAKLLGICLCSLVPISLSGCSKPVSIPVTGNTNTDVGNILAGVREDAAREGNANAYVLDAANVLLKIDRAKGLAALDKAVATAKQIEIPSAREAMLLEIAKAVGAVDPSRAVAIVTSNRIAFTRHSEELLYSIVAEVAKADVSKALQLVSLFALKQLKADALLAVAREAAKKDVTRGRQIVETIPVLQRGQMMWEFARSIAEDHPDEAAQIVSTIDFPGGRAELLLILAQTCRKTHSDKAYALAKEALTAAKKMAGDISRQALVRARIAEMISAKEPDKAVSLLNEAERLAKDVTDLAQRDAVRLEIVRARGNMDLAAAKSLCTKLGYTYQANGFVDLAKSKKAADVKIRASLLAQALAATEKIQSRKNREKVLLRAVDVITGLPKREATPLLEKAYRVAIRLADSDPTAHLRVAVKMAKVNREAALSHFAEAIQAARAYPNKIYRASALLSVAKFLVDVDKQQGQQAFEEVFKIIEESKQSAERDRLRARAAVAAAKLCTAQAVAAAQKIPSAPAREQTLLRVAKALAGIEEPPPSAQLRRVIQLPLGF